MDNSNFSKNLQNAHKIEELITIISRLRGENGCPWDKVQTHETLREGMIEEAYEVVEAINQNDMDNLKEELGDVLLQVLFHAQLAEESGAFTLDDVIQRICDKMVYRHPHVFSDAHADTPDEVLVNWEALKKKEKSTTTQAEVMKQIPNNLPALTRAKKVQKKAADVGFDFYETGGALEKAFEELGELQEAIDLQLPTIEEEYGDFLFAMTNIARFLKINPEFALTKATKKFITRFEYIENLAISSGKDVSTMTLAELDSLWDKAKIALSSKENI